MNAPMSSLNGQLSEEHIKELTQESAIAPEVILERGCWTERVKAQLTRLGFSNNQISTPALVLPWHRLGEKDPALYQIKPNVPRLDKSGRTIKYEVPRNSRNILDVHPRVRENLGNPQIPLYVTEGIKKGDSLVSRGLTVVTLVGVWSFIGRNEHGGKVTLPDWDEIALNDRHVYIVFDSDVMAKKQVYFAQERLRNYLAAKGAKVSFIYLPDAEGGIKQGVDDFFASGKGVEELHEYASDEIRKPPGLTIEYDNVLKNLDGAPVPDNLLVPLDYRITNAGVFYVYYVETKEGTEEKERTVANAPVVITKVFDNLEGGTVDVELCWLVRGRWVKRVVDREMIATRQITGLARYGFPVTCNNANDLIEYVSEFERENAERLPVELLCPHMGWVSEGGFLLGRKFLGQGTPTAFKGEDEGNDQLADGIVSAGSFDAWHEGASDVVVKYPKVALALYASFAAVLLKILEAPSFILDSAGETTGGKTTILQLAASVWGNPDLDSDEPTAMSTWDSTRVGFERTSAVLHSLPVIFDETKKARHPSDVAGAVYAFASGHGRARGSKSGLSGTAAWKSVLISSGEQPITSFTRDAGQHARVLSMWGSPFGERTEEKAQEVIALTDTIRSNYGHAGERFVRYLLEHRDEWPEWCEAYKVARKEYGERAAGNVVGARLAGPLAAIAVAAAVARLALDLPAVDPVSPLIEEFVESAASADKPREALRAVLSWASSRSSQFYGRHKKAGNAPVVPPQGWLGWWPKNGKHVGFFKEPLEGLLTDLGYSTTDIQRSWRDRGWIETDKGRAGLTKNHKAKDFEKVFGRKAIRLVTIPEHAIEEVMNHE